MFRGDSKAFALVCGVGTHVVVPNPEHAPMWVHPWSLGGLLHKIDADGVEVFLLHSTALRDVINGVDPTVHEPLPLMEHAMKKAVSRTASPEQQPAFLEGSIVGSGTLGPS